MIADVILSIITVIIISIILILNKENIENWADSIYKFDD